MKFTLVDPKDAGKPSLIVKEVSTHSALLIVIMRAYVFCDLFVTTYSL